MELYRSTSRALFDDHLGDILVVVVEGSNDFIQSTHDHRAHARKKNRRENRTRGFGDMLANGRTDGWTHDHHAVSLEHRAAPQLGRRVQLTKLLERPLHFRIRLEHPAK